VSRLQASAALFLLFAANASGCIFISDAEHQQRRDDVIDANRPEDTGPDDTGPTGPPDADGDGYREGPDCDDDDPGVHPDAAELCDGIDNDCDGAVDEPDALDALTWYADADGDGHGDPDQSQRACEAPSGMVADNTDCDDGDAAIHPLAEELCNGVDDDCDGEIDDGLGELSTWYVDGDGDGFGDPHSPVQACSQPSDAVKDASDCDDSDAAVHPDAAELCNGVDDDCDGTVDDDATDISTWYADADGDGYGDLGSSQQSCSQPSGHVSNATDCDDGDAAINLGADELCDGVDNDCDGTVDGPDALDASTWYADADGDGYGDASSSSVACSAPARTVSDSSDCDDGDATVFPGAEELCDGGDDDCDGTVDEEAIDMSSWYADADGDGYGDAASSTEACSAPSGSVADSSDCDDGDASVHPGAAEYCDGVDSDCDGSADAPGLVTFTDSAGAVSDYSASFGSGSSSRSAGIDLSDDGYLAVCEGTYYVELSIDADALTIAGVAGADRTVLQGDGSSSVIVLEESGSSLRLGGVTVTGGSENKGGALYADNTGHTVTIDGCVFSDSSADKGGCVYLRSSTVTISGTSFEGCEATTNGGGLYVDGTTLGLDAVGFTGNSAGQYGGGLYVEDATVMLSGGLFEDNEAVEYGGGAYLQRCSLDEAGSSFLGNAAGIGGGGLGVKDGSAVLDSSLIQGNVAVSWSGGLHVSGSDVELVSSLIVENEVDTSSVLEVGGGALLYNGSTLVCTGSPAEDAGIYANTAGDGGGVYLYDSGCTLHSYECDWGSAAAGNDNSPDDVDLSMYGDSYTGYELDENFSCSGGASGTCL
jgi:predicted outer membrane repeat protein